MNGKFPFFVHVRMKVIIDGETSRDIYCAQSLPALFKCTITFYVDKCLRDTEYISIDDESN